MCGATSRLVLTVVLSSLGGGSFACGEPSSAGSGTQPQVTDSAVREGGELPDGGGERDSAQPADGRQPETCDGSADARLFYISVNSQRGLPGSAFMSNPGYPYIIVDGLCNVWIRPDAWAATTTFRAEASDLAALKEVLRLSEWQNQRIVYCVTASDVPSWLLGAPNSSLAIGTILTPGCKEPPQGLMSDIEMHIRAIASKGAAVHTPILYTLVPFSGSIFGDTFRGAAPWPLSTPLPTTVDESPRIAEGGDAQELRRLRDAYFRGDLGSRADLFIPIEQQDGSRYELRLRDRTPFETEDGTFSPQSVAK
jgi:hypothetical protein